MDVRSLCLGVLSAGPTSGYGIRKTIAEWFGHFAHASLGAIYPALGKLVAAGAVEIVGAPGASLEKRVFRITDVGREEFRQAVGACSGIDTVRSPFLAGLFFSHELPMDDIHRLVEERLAGLRGEQRRLRSIPSADLTEGQRFTIRYSLAQIGAAIGFLEHEGRAIVTAIERERTAGNQ